MTLTTDGTTALFLRALTDELGADLVATDPDIVASYRHDQSQFTDSSEPAAVLMPRTTDHVSAMLAHAHRFNVTVVPRGAGSGLSGGANASEGSVVLSLHRMNRIVEIDPGNRTVVVEPGVITADLRAAVGEKGLHYPPDPGSVDFCSIGGNIATNAGGMCCVKYGVTGDFVLALCVVMADGRVLRTGHKTVKGVAGYDLTSLFVGSEGTLGVITEATLRLVPKPGTAHTLVASFPTLESAGLAVAGVVDTGLTPSMLEILDRTTIRAVDAMTHMGLGDGVEALLLAQSDEPDAAAVLERIEQLCESAGATDVVASDDVAESAMLLEARRMALPALEQLGDWLLDDVCVPRTRIVELIAYIEEVAERHDLTIGVFGHAGDGNLHPTIIFDNGDPTSRASAIEAFNDITERALELGGTVTGEHGIGQLKKSWLGRELGPVGTQVHHALKNALDPSGTLSPLAVLPPLEEVDLGNRS
ncbi:FAD-linked oxidase [Rhodococcus sp. Leaf7]|uniref:FAD-binding oxidoreductase n=1 Tax=unclassified Rhodococcus (in: high G+C Gram-positive bacteria) TaxID=192944 RepID=UPI0006F6F473|nr:MULTISPECIES: FAD-linked oxidase C-terminal domain-containing protein [unclassified Rhodococcus (in: high G+C Gram-positive bacteria)]KQU07887.1 FAD-linked oxidase [Rhodococcus sp. Leaf7]KQU43406.1 FAD-linked oxidase [Rhodococcus sp. Leaf247]